MTTSLSLVESGRLLFSPSIHIKDRDRELSETTPKVAGQWRTALTEPFYPENNLKYHIDVSKPPMEHPKTDGLWVVTTKDGDRLMMWNSTFLALCHLLDDNGWKNTDVAFSRPKDSKVTQVRVV